MLKKIFTSLIIIAASLFVSQNVNAQDKYNVSAIIDYKILETGSTAVTHTITLTNNTSYEYAKNYVFTLTNIDPRNIKAYESGSPIPIDLEAKDNEHKLTLSFLEPVFGKGKTRTFLVSYEEENFAKINGDVWEILIPKIESKYDESKVILSVPEILGNEAIIFPDPVSKNVNDQRIIFTFDGMELSRSGINAVFGKFQVYSIKLKYHLENSEDKKVVTDIALPPDTTTQKLYYSKIDPVPEDITIDTDGNWIASFELKPKEKKDVITEGFVQVFADPIKSLSLNPTSTLENLKEKEYWESNNPKIKEIAQNLRTPQRIYNFVVQNLTYNNGRVKPDTQRLGALNALSSTNNAICTEFTDLFIALSRAAGIPAREINGYAHSDNPNLQPLSLFSDVLHSWPEYWNEEEQMWIPVDPTWGSTSGVDYFNSFDLKHIAFVIHGASSTHPLPAGSYRSKDLKKDVFVELSKLPQQKGGGISITHKIKNSINPFKKILMINIKNNDYSAYYNLMVEVNFSDVTATSMVIPSLIPYSEYTTTVDLPIGFMASKAPEYATITLDSKEETFYFNKALFSIWQLILLFILIVLFLMILAIRSKRIDLSLIMNGILKLINNVKKIKKDKVQ